MLQSETSNTDARSLLQRAEPLPKIPVALVGESTDRATDSGHLLPMPSLCYTIPPRLPSKPIQSPADNKVQADGRVTACTPEARRPSILDGLNPQNFALPDTPIITPQANFEGYTVAQLRRSIKQLGKRYITREQAVLALRQAYTANGWLPNVQLTQLQLMSPARRQTLEETITDWIKNSPWYLLILTFVPLNKRKMLEHMKACKLNVSLETLNSYLVSQNVLMAEGEETEKTSLGDDKLRIRYPRENGEKQLTLSEVFSIRVKKTRANKPDIDSAEIVNTSDRRARRYKK